MIWRYLKVTLQLRKQVAKTGDYMSLYNSDIYIEDIQTIANMPYSWEKLSGKSLALSGGTGMIGSFLVDVLMHRNEKYNQNTHIYLFTRDIEKCKRRFDAYTGSGWLHFVNQDVNEQIKCEVEGQVINNIDYVIHGASNTHPMAYSTDPIGTISSNVIGTNNLLSWSKDVGCSRFVFFSTVEVYGENRQDTDKFDEKYLGYIDCNTLRAGYPESKRAGEALCQAYIKQYDMDVVIPRLSRTYGPTMLMSDTKALSQFIIKSVNGEDIVLKSEGTQLFSYTYVADAVSAIFKIMFEGVCGEAYNIVSDESDMRLKDLAKMLADFGGKRVIFELPHETERAGYSTATKAVLDKTKLEKLGWKSIYTMDKGLKNTVEILRNIKR